MKILVLTPLYPDEIIKTYGKQTPAIHDFLKFWDRKKDVDVLAVKLRYFPIDEKDYKPRKAYVRDGVTVENLYIFDRGIVGKRTESTLFFFLWILNRISHLGIEKFNLYRLKKILANNGFKPDIILAHSMLSFKEANLTAKYFNVPYILAFHGADVKNFNENKRWADYISINLNKASAWVARSPSIYSNLKNHSQFQKQPSYIALSGIEENEILPFQFKEKKLVNWKIEGKLIKLISVCALIKLKNIDTNLRALAKLPSKLNFIYHIIGEGEEMQNLKNLCVKLNLSEKVIFHGNLNRTKVLKKLEKSHIFLMVSAPETFGMAFLEAFAKGNLVIGAKENGIDGVAKDGVEAIFVYPENIDELATKLSSIIYESTYIELKDMLFNANKLISNMSKEKMAKDYLEYVREIGQTGKEQKL
ncbi:glycosyltransferase family 4 protein [Salegentibacter sp. Hel_I_6]|uniref:glycosyltransferase family 4 protein n=1 Tax=Salegentibacter sp. Hel_I_6 TaxID=1250278 RepID=UPI00055D967F|nr:glycosyltransferase family 4 protein [Salegentibacter sp. Hel_I_6]